MKKNLSTYINVNHHLIRKNRKEGTNLPVIIVRRGKSGPSKYGSHIHIDGPSELIYSPHKPILKCGARLVLKTDAKVQITP